MPSVCAYIGAIKLGSKRKVDLYTGPTTLLGLDYYGPPDHPEFFSEITKRKVSEFLRSTSSVGKKKVILAPYAKTVNEVSMDLWKMLSFRLKESGYTIFTNVGKEESELPGTIPLSLAPDALILAAKDIGWVISLRSGLCDVLLHSGIRLTVIYSEELVRGEKSDTYIKENLRNMFPTSVHQIILKNNAQEELAHVVNEILLQSNI